MKLYIPEVKKGEGNFLTYNGTIELEDIKLDTFKEQCVRLHVNLKAAYVQKRVLLKGNWQAEINTECHRCLSPFTLQLGDMVYDEFTHITAGVEHGLEIERIELNDGEHFAFKGDILDLADYFKQLFFMSQPLKMLCRADCKGLCSSCGANKNIEACSCDEKSTDPRWVILEKFKQNSKK